MPTQEGSEQGGGGEKDQVWPDMRLLERRVDFITMAVGATWWLLRWEDDPSRAFCSG